MRDHRGPHSKANGCIRRTHRYHDMTSRPWSQPSRTQRHCSSFAEPAHGAVRSSRVQHIPPWAAVAALWAVAGVPRAVAVGGVHVTVTSIPTTTALPLAAASHTTPNHRSSHGEPCSQLDELSQLPPPVLS